VSTRDRVSQCFSSGGRRHAGSGDPAQTPGKVARGARSDASFTIDRVMQAGTQRRVALLLRALGAAVVRSSALQTRQASTMRRSSARCLEQLGHTLNARRDLGGRRRA
jgi:hypothetical protein